VVTCAACGHQLHTDDRFCGKCGHGVNAQENTGVLNLDVDLEHHRDTAVMVVWRGPNEGASYPLIGDLVDVGRSPDSKIFLDDITVSRHHARLTHNAEGWTLTDAGSLNGSYVNRTRITAATPLRSGDEVQIGKYRFTFYTGTGDEQ
jgi:hypothetical protein